MKYDLEQLSTIELLDIFGESILEPQDNFDVYENTRKFLTECYGRYTNINFEVYSLLVWNAAAQILIFERDF